MEKAEVNVEYKSGMSFEATVNGIKLLMDADESNGGEGKGPRPKPLMLAALGGCTGMDVVSMLKKMKVEYDSFNIKVIGDLAEEHPKKYIKMKVIYELKGKNIDIEKVKRAVQLSEDKYCGVSAVYRDSLEIESEIVLL